MRKAYFMTHHLGDLIKIYILKIIIFFVSSQGLTMHLHKVHIFDSGKSKKCTIASGIKALHALEIEVA